MRAGRWRTSAGGFCRRHDAACVRLTMSLWGKAFLFDEGRMRQLFKRPKTGREVVSWRDDTGLGGDGSDSSRMHL